MQPYKAVLLMSVLVGLLAGAGQAKAGPWTAVQLTDNDYRNWGPDVSGSNVAWDGRVGDRRPTEIFVYDGTTTMRLTDKDYGDVSPEVPGSNVVRWGNSSEQSEILPAFPDCNENGIPDDTDTDGDGLIDDCDACPDSDLSDTIVIDGCDTGVANMMLGDGCTMADLIAACADDAANHGDFVRCVAHLTNEWKRDGSISGRDKGHIQQCAAQANIPFSPLAGSWLVSVTPENEPTEEPYCIFVNQVGNFVSYHDWHKEYAVLADGTVDGDAIAFSGEALYYGETISYTSVATLSGDGMIGTYQYTGAHQESGNWMAVKEACKQEKAWVRVANIQADYVLEFYVWDLIPEGTTITAATVAGADIGTLDMLPSGSTEYFPWYVPYSYEETAPTPDATYTFTVHYDDESTGVSVTSVRETFVDFPTSVLPADGATVDTATPTFSWEPPECACQGYYRIWVLDSQGSDVWSVYLGSEATSIMYNYDGAGAPLQSGETYEWRLIAFDQAISGGPDNNVWVIRTFTVQLD